MLQTKLEPLTSGRRLRIARLGSGPPVIFLHGYPDNLQIWSELAMRLADHFEVIAFDWPGMGYSDAWSGGTTPFHMADRLSKILDELAIERANLVGMDMGGQPALVFAAQHPERVHHLVVMNSFVFWNEKTSWEIQLLRKYGCNRFIIRNFPLLVFKRAEMTFLPRGMKLPFSCVLISGRVFRRVKYVPLSLVFALVIRGRWSGYLNYTRQSLAPRLCCGENTISTFRRSTQDGFIKQSRGQVCKSFLEQNTGWRGISRIQWQNQLVGSWLKDWIPPDRCGLATSARHSAESRRQASGPTSAHGCSLAKKFLRSIVTSPAARRHDFGARKRRQACQGRYGQRANH